MSNRPAQMAETASESCTHDQDVRCSCLNMDIGICVVLISYMRVEDALSWRCLSRFCTRIEPSLRLWELLWHRDFQHLPWLTGSDLVWPESLNQRVVLVSRCICIVLQCPKCHWCLGNWTCIICNSRLTPNSQGSLGCPQGCGAIKTPIIHCPCERPMTFKWGLLQHETVSCAIPIVTEQATLKFSFKPSVEMFGCRQCQWGVNLNSLTCFMCQNAGSWYVDLDHLMSTSSTALQCGCRQHFRGPLLAGSGHVSVQCACTDANDLDDIEFFDLNFFAVLKHSWSIFT